MFKSKRRSNDLKFAMDILSLALGTVRVCFQDELIEEADKTFETCFSVNFPSNER
jgi:hypothetical protein